AAKPVAAAMGTVHHIAGQHVAPPYSGEGVTKGTTDSNSLSYNGQQILIFSRAAIIVYRRAPRESVVRSTQPPGRPDPCRDPTPFGGGGCAAGVLPARGRPRPAQSVRRHSGPPPNPRKGTVRAPDGGRPGVFAAVEGGGAAGASDGPNAGGDRPGNSGTP